MPEFIKQLHLRLVELGCPTRRLQRMVREVAEHREDLVRAAVAEGVAVTEAQARADQRLGNPRELAGNLMVTLRRSSWWGRHFLLAFGFLPLLAFPVLWALFLVAGLSLEFAVGFGWDEKKLHEAANHPVTFHPWIMAEYGADNLALALVALVICWLARRSGVSLTWMTIACAIGSIYALVFYTHIGGHNFFLGITNNAQWKRGMIPLLVAGMFCLRQYWAVHILRRRLAD